MVEATQADRDAAAGTMDGEWADPHGARMIREGKWDNHHIVQAFAMHRLREYARGTEDSAKCVDSYLMIATGLPVEKVVELTTAIRDLSQRFPKTMDRLSQSEQEDRS
jgi:hypothetical protein